GATTSPRPQRLGFSPGTPPDVEHSGASRSAFRGEGAGWNRAAVVQTTYEAAQAAHCPERVATTGIRTGGGPIHPPNEQWQRWHSAGGKGGEMSLQANAGPGIKVRATGAGGSDFLENLFYRKIIRPSGLRRVLSHVCFLHRDG